MTLITKGTCPRCATESSTHRNTSRLPSMRHSAGDARFGVSTFHIDIGAIIMHKYLLALSATAALASGQTLADDHDKGGVPALDHVFVLVLENHNAFTSFGSEGIIGNPNAPHITALAQKYNFASNYN